MVSKEYTGSITNYQRRISTEVQVGHVPMGGKNPLRVQTMTNTNTMDTGASVAQVASIMKTGADYIRLTARNVKEAGNLANIKKILLEKGLHVPLVADIHFQPQAAEIAALHVEKIRINPGNFSDQKKFETLQYPGESYMLELKQVEDKLVSLIDICKTHERVLRIGVNHGSLSDRIMSRYGDTPAGMVESAMEFLRICIKHDFHRLVISMKSSNTKIMVYSTRMLVAKMNAENMYFPLHLGVTEAGNDEEGRIKSAAGIGALLADGLGDTIRISLTEDPEKEIPVAKKIVRYIEEKQDHEEIPRVPFFFNPYQYEKRKSLEIQGIGGDNSPLVIADFNPIIQDREDITWEIAQKDEEWKFEDAAPDFLYLKEMGTTMNIPVDTRIIIQYIHWKELTNREENVFPLFTPPEYMDANTQLSSRLNFLSIDHGNLTKDLIERVNQVGCTVIIAQGHTKNPVGEFRYIIGKLSEGNCKMPVVLKMSYFENELESLQLKSAMDLGVLLIDGLVDGIWISNSGNIPAGSIVSTAFHILQATGERITSTEYISCPSCGRTLIDIQGLLKEVKAKTKHLKHLKIGVMGCIVNGPGEMADADYGLVGAGKGKVTLYKGKEQLRKNIPEEIAVDELLKIIGNQ